MVFVDFHAFLEGSSGLYRWFILFTILIFCACVVGWMYPAQEATGAPLWMN